MPRYRSEKQKQFAKDLFRGQRAPLYRAMRLNHPWTRSIKDCIHPRDSWIPCAIDGWPIARQSWEFSGLRGATRRHVAMVEHGRVYSDAEERALHRMQDELYAERHAGIFFEGGTQ